MELFSIKIRCTFQLVSTIHLPLTGSLMLLSCSLKRKANRRNKMKIVIFATESFIIDRFIIEIFVVEAPGGTPGAFFNHSPLYW